MPHKHTIWSLSIITIMGENMVLHKTCPIMSYGMKGRMDEAFNRVFPPHMSDLLTFNSFEDMDTYFANAVGILGKTS